VAEPVPVTTAAPALGSAPGAPDAVTFSFGANWQDFISTMPGDAVERALADHRRWLEDVVVQGARVLDIGCGSGLHALVFQLRGAGAVTAIDRDPASVAATRQLRGRLGSPAGWTVEEGSILDQGLVERLALSPFDIVYSWGVLHHTGALWQALEHAFRLVAPGGRLWISLYAAGPRYARHLALKQRYNAASRLGKWWLERRHIALIMWGRLRQGRNPWAWNQAKERGMDTWHDLLDWLGGLPYEVAGIGAVVAAAGARGFSALRIAEAPEGSCQIFLFQRAADPPAPATAPDHAP
jgi:SAM-dependent methyltransferase